MRKQLLIGIDAGTTNMKIAAFCENGERIAFSSVKTPVKRENGLDIIDFREHRSAMLSLITSAVDEIKNKWLSPADICGIAFTSIAESGYGLDENGEAVFPLTLWYDRSTVGMERQWAETFGSDRVHRITGQLPQHNYTVNKLLWLKTNYPELYSKIKRWHCVSDYFAFLLTGESVMDLSLASRTMMLDISQKRWSEEILTHAGIDSNILPDLAVSAVKTGVVKKDIAAITGLMEGTPVFTGGHDHICGGLSSGALTPGIIADSSGTAEMLLTAVKSHGAVTDRTADGFNFGVNVIKNMYYLAGAIPSSGRTYDWFERELSKNGKRESSPAGANGLMFLPHIAGGSSPKRESFLKGAFIGITSSSTHADFVKAVYEGLCYEFRLITEKMLGGAPIRIITMGGGSKNADWQQTKADIMGMDIVVPEERECTALGAALLAGIGSGVYSLYNDAVDKTFRIGRVFSAQSDYDYSKGYEIYKSAASMLMEFCKNQGN